MAALKYIMALLFWHLASFLRPISVDVFPSPKRASPEIYNMPILKLVDIGQNLSELALTWSEYV